jgi:predicted ATPase/DNA-binding SARP family transcriptional activator
MTKTAMIQVYVLGEIRAYRENEPLNLGPAKQRAVLAALALHAGEVVSTEALREAVWGRAQPRSARQVVHTYIARLRHVFEPELPPHNRVHVIGSTSAGYRLVLQTDRVDVTRFHTRYAEAHKALADNDAVRAFALLGSALRHWDDPELPELTRLLHTADEVPAMRRAWCDAALDYVTIGLELGRGATVLPVAQRLATAEPLHEEAQARYLAVLEQCGRRAAALDHFHHVRLRLGEELGVEPGAQLAGAYRRIVRGTAAAAPTPRRTIRPPWRGPGPGPDRLVGRDADVAALTGLLAEHRVLTVTGPPGCGKSAAAMQVAIALHHHFSAGVLVVEASELADGPALAAALARRAGGRPDDDPAALLGDGHALLVLDNVEHLVTACARAVDEVIRSCRRVSVLVTSRERLALPYEMVWPLHPLPVAGRDGAVELFARRAAQVSPGFRLTPDNADTVAAICARLDGLPLAVELAAACLASDSLDEVAARVARPLDELNPPRRCLPAHQRSLRTTLLHSLDCLTPAERHCLQRLAALPACFGEHDAAQAWAGVPGGPVDVRVTLRRLVDTSLLSVSHPGEGARYRMLWLVRCCAAELAQSCVTPPG